MFSLNKTNDQKYNNYIIKNEFCDFFENPNLFKLIKIFFLNNGFYLIIILITFAYIIYKSAPNQNLMKSFFKHKENFSIANIINFIFDKNIIKLKVKTSELNIIKNFILFIKSMIISYDIEHFNKLSKLDLLVHFFISFFMILILILLVMFLKSVILAKNFKNFRKTIFNEFLDNASVINFYNPQKCIKFIESILFYMEMLINTFGEIIFLFVIILLRLYLCFYKEYQTWNKILVIWIIFQIILMIFTLFLYKEPGYELELLTIERNYINNFENQKLFKMFNNNDEDYDFFIIENCNEKILNQINISLLPILGNMLGFIILAYGLIFDVYINNGIFKVLPNFLVFIICFSVFPGKIIEFFAIKSKITTSFSHFTCNTQKKMYISRNEILNIIKHIAS